MKKLPYSTLHTWAGFKRKKMIKKKSDGRTENSSRHHKDPIQKDEVQSPALSAEERGSYFDAESRVETISHNKAVGRRRHLICPRGNDKCG